MFLKMPEHPAWFLPNIIKRQIGSIHEPGKILARNNGMIYWDGGELLYQDADGKQWRVKLEPMAVENDAEQPKEKKKKKCGF